MKTCKNKAKINQGAKKNVYESVIMCIFGRRFLFVYRFLFDRGKFKVYARKKNDIPIISCSSNLL